jgi:hypothetical protein
MGIEQLQLTTGDRRLLCDEHADARAAQLAGFLREGREGEQCEDCQEIAARPERRLLLEALTVFDEMIDNLDDSPNPFLDTGCNECTEGCTPNRFNTGPCWRHAAKKLLAGRVLTDAARKSELHAAVTAALLSIEESNLELPLELATAISERANERLDALVDAHLI